MFLIALFISCKKNEKNTPDKNTIMTIDKRVFNFGNIKEDEMYNGYFIVKNTGLITLAIYDVSTECGCTVIDSYKKLVEPKDTCMIRFSFNTFGKSGIQSKTITLVTNTDSTTNYLKIKANVLK